jgi:hypothetical protein
MPLPNIIAPTRFPCRVNRRESADKINQHIALLIIQRAKIHRRTQIQQEPRDDLAVFHILADVRRVHARADVPVNVADVVLRLILAQVGKIHAEAAERLR